jgi:hypothetical protein
MCLYTFLEFFSCNLIPLLLLSIESDNLNAICTLGCAEHTGSSPSATYVLGFAQHTGMTAKHQVFVAQWARLQPGAWILQDVASPHAPHQTVQSTVKKHSQSTVYTLQYKIVQFIMNSLTMYSSQHYNKTMINFSYN